MIGSLLFISFLTAQASPSPVGMILQTEGEVFVQKGSVRNPAKMADLLYPGDQVVTTTGQATFLFCPSSERMTVKNAARIELTAQTATSRAGAAPAKAAARCTLPKVALGAEELERIGGMRPRGDPPVAVFLGGPVTTARPTFEWASVPGAASYQINVTTSAGAPVWQQRATAASLTYPADMTPLKDGAYQWEVRAGADGKILAQQTANFEVKPNAGLSKTPSDPLDKLIHATELENAGYYAEAAAFYRENQRTHPEDARIARHLVWLYWNAGLIRAAIELMEKANIR